jgi:hypothetical protein
MAEVTVQAPGDQPIRFRSVVDYHANYRGRGEFYTGIRNGDAVLLRVENQTFTCSDGTVKSSISMSIQSLERPGAWLSMYDRTSELESIRAVR